MNTELYTAASGMALEARRVEMISHNLANANSLGFRSERSFAAVYGGTAGTVTPEGFSAHRPVALAGSYELPGPGPLRQTGGSLDVALTDGDFFSVETEAGVRYSRLGSLRVSDEDRLVDIAGNPVLDTRGAPIVGLASGAVISDEGEVFERLPDGDESRGRIAFFQDPAGLLSRRGDGLLDAGGRDDELVDAAGARVEVGFLEGAVADPIGEMIRLVDAQRAFQGYQRLINLTMNDVNRRIIDAVAR